MDKTEHQENTRVFSGNSTLARVFPIPANREIISSRYGEKNGYAPGTQLGMDNDQLGENTRVFSGNSTLARAS